MQTVGRQAVFCTAISVTHTTGLRNCHTRRRATTKRISGVARRLGKNMIIVRRRLTSGVNYDASTRSADDAARPIGPADVTSTSSKSRLVVIRRRYGYDERRMS